jgi:hypothetical protein
LFLPFRPRLTGLIRPVCPTPAMDLTHPLVRVGNVDLAQSATPT